MRLRDEEEQVKEVKNYTKTITIIIICGIILGILATLFYTKFAPAMKETNTSFSDLFKRNPFGDKEYVRILVMGVDNTDKNGKGLSDTMVLFNINTKTKEVRALSFPRDTYVEGLPSHKLNAAHRVGGPEKTVEVIEETFLYPTTIDYYIKTTTKGLREMVDLLGGVYMVVEKNMNYDDNWGNLHIHLKASPEKQLLNGVDAEGYVRFRKDRFGDTGYTYKDGEKVAQGRIARQQKFLMALCNRVISLPSRSEKADFIKTCYEKGYIESNLNLRDWSSMADFFSDIKPEQMMREVLPGEPKMIRGVSYWVANEEEVPGIVSKYVLFEGVNPLIPIESNGEEVTPSKIPSETRVALLNGSGVKGLASKIGEVIKLKGYTNYTTGNADSFDYETTTIKCKDQSLAFGVKDALGSGKIVIDETIEEDIVVIIGKDLDIKE